MNRIKKIFKRIRIIHTVSRSLGADPGSRRRMLWGGLWFLLHDTWKSSLRFSAHIRFEGSTHEFFFEDVSDFELFDEVFLQTSYRLEPDSVGIVTIVDMGANIGVSSLWFALRWPKAVVHCIEPDPNNFRRLSQNTRTVANISCHNLAVWNTNGEIPFYADSHRGSSSSIFPGGAKKKKVMVPSCSLEQLFSTIGGDPVSIMKIDVEGAEETIFAGFDGFSRISTLVGELHHDLCDTTELVRAIKDHYSEVGLYPLKKERDYVIATRQQAARPPADGLP